MSFFKIFMHIGKIMRLFKSLRVIALDLITKKQLPVCGETSEFLKALSELVRSGIVDIPGVDEAAIAKAIDDLDKEIQCKV